MNDTKISDLDWRIRSDLALKIGAWWRHLLTDPEQKTRVSGKNSQEQARSYFQVSGITWGELLKKLEDPELEMEDVREYMMKKTEEIK